MFSVDDQRLIYFNYDYPSIPIGASFQGGLTQGAFDRFIKATFEHHMRWIKEDLFPPEQMHGNQKDTPSSTQA
jgi:hypothetical protein